MLKDVTNIKMYGDSVVITIPKSVFLDSSFPFESKIIDNKLEPIPITIKIEKDILIIEKNNI